MSYGNDYFDNSPSSLGDYYGQGGSSVSLGSATSTLLISSGANAIVPGSGAVVAAGLGIFGKLFGGADDARKQRVAWTLAQANAGSPTAAALIVAAPENVADDEKGFWRTAFTQIDPTVLSLSTRLYPFGLWPKGQPDFYSDVNGQTHRAIVSEVNQVNQTPPVPSSTTLPGMRSTAPFNWTPILIGGGLTLGAIAFAGRRRRSRR